MNLILNSNSIFSYDILLLMPRLFTSKSIAVYAEVFTNLAAGFFGSFVIFPGIFGIKTPLDFLGLLIVNLPSGILCLLIALRLKEQTDEH